MVYLYGASGHAKVVMDIANACGMEVGALVDDNPAVNALCGKPVLHSAEGLSPMIVTVGDCAVRRRIAGSLNCDFATLVHPSAVVSPSASVAEGSVVMQGAVVQADARIGRHCIVNTGATVDHDCRVGDFCHIAPGCTLCGLVEVGEGSWIGAGTVIVQGVRIGRDCFIGAGSLVLEDIPDGTLAYGHPACPIRKI